MKKTRYLKEQYNNCVHLEQVHLKIKIEKAVSDNTVNELEKSLRDFNNDLMTHPMLVKQECK